MSKEHSTAKSFSYAASGIKLAWKNEPNFRTQIIIGIIAVILGFFLGLNNIEWLVLITIIFFVLLLELINTSLEALVDLVSPEYGQKAKIAKDTAAAAVLMASILSLTVGAILFIPKILFLLK